MNAWFEILASNVVLATVLTAAAAVCARLRRSPALVHVLCVLALLKLVTPPLLTLPVLPPVVNPTTPAFPIELLLAMPMDFPAAPIEAEPAAGAFDATTLLLGAWVLGSLAVLGMALARTRRFATLLRGAAAPSAGLAAELRRLARQMGLRKPPALAVVSGRVSPMLWPARRGLRLVLPAALLRVLSPDQRATLLVHELAHVRRRDHWVRHLEAAVSVLFWWLPTVWWLRRRLHDAEEQCCDAWVVWTMPEKERAYTDALLLTVDFLSGPHLALPPQASGAGHVHHLKQRLTMIMEATTPRRLSRAGRLTALALAVLFLPALPTRAQKPEKTNDETMREALQRISELEALVERMSVERSQAADRAAETVLRASKRLEKDNESFRKRMENTLERALETAQKQLQRGDMEAASAHLKDALETRTDLAQAQLERAKKALEKWDDYIPKVRATLENMKVEIPESAWRESEEALRKAVERYRDFGEQFDAADLNAKISDEISEHLTRAWKKDPSFNKAFDSWFRAMRDGERIDESKLVIKNQVDAVDRETRIQQIQDQIASMQKAMKELQAELRRLQKEEF